MSSFQSGRVGVLSNSEANTYPPVASLNHRNARESAAARRVCMPRRRQIRRIVGTRSGEPPPEHDDRKAVKPVVGAEGDDRIDGRELRMHGDPSRNPFAELVAFSAHGRRKYRCAIKPAVHLIHVPRAHPSNRRAASSERQMKPERSSAVVGHLPQTFAHSARASGLATASCSSSMSCVSSASLRTSASVRVVVLYLVVHSMEAS